MSFLSYNLPLVALFPFLGAPIAAWAARFNRLASAWAAGIITLITLALLAPALPAAFQNETLIQSWSWLPSLGLDFAFRLDGLALLFSLMILLIGLLVIVYARYYLSTKDSMGRFFAYLLMFMGSMLGIVLSENLILLVIFWELTSLTSFLLISYWQYQQAARDGARMALAITGAGGLAMLAGVLMLGHVVGSYNLTDVLAAGDLIRSHSLYLPILVLILLGVFTKSAQFPFHFWLPHAMAAPTPVSAYLHSATMVKAGIFLLARLFPALSGTEAWSWLVGSAGMITMILGAYTALFKHDLKGLLAYSTISHLGLITLLFSFSTQLAVVAAIFHIINHATFKASLFMVAGIIDHECGSRDMRRIHGLLKYMPHTAVLAMIAASAMAGVPLLNGFLSKEMFFEQAVVMASSNSFAWAIPVLVTFGSFFSVAYSLRFIHDVFFNGEPEGLTRTPHEAPRSMRIPVDILVLLCVGVGIAPMILVAPILTIAVSASLQEAAPQFNLAVWHGLNLPLIMSAIAIAVGTIIYFNRAKLFRWHDDTFPRIDARILFNRGVYGLLAGSAYITRLFDQKSLQNAVSWVMLAAVLALVYGFIQFDSPLFGHRALLPIDFLTLFMAIVLIFSSILAAVMHHHRLVALIIIGVVGLIVSLTFVKFSAPDLALTQLSVEVVTTVLLLLALFFLPQHTRQERSKKRMTRDLFLSITAGIGTTLLAMAVMTRDYLSISDFFLENSKPGGGGTNAVNVILVDFRGFDTMGEIVVLSLAGLGIFALLQKLRLPAALRDTDGREWSHESHPPIMQTLTRLLFPLMLIVSVFIFMRGHNLPGGGFIAGLIAAVALISQYLANGIAWTNARLKLDMHKVIAFGLMTAVITGVVSMGFSFPFLTSAFTYINWPVIGTFEIASAMTFDLGVFLVVVGSTVLILVELGKLTHASHFIDQQERY